jgi:hypothetical protein
MVKWSNGRHQRDDQQCAHDVPVQQRMTEQRAVADETIETGPIQRPHN